MITLPDKSRLREDLAKIIAETCRCEPQALLENKVFTEVIEHFDSLAMLEVLLGIESEYGILTDDLLPNDYRTQEEIIEYFPKNLDELVEHLYRVSSQLNDKNVEKLV